jgi:O-antigen/teichoic acid export membrane protein
MFQTIKAAMPNESAVLRGRRSSLRTDFSWMFVGNVVYAGAQFAILMLLTKLVRPEMVGQYALGLAIVYPIMMFANLQLRAEMTSGARPEIHFGDYLSLRLLTTTVSLAVIFAITRFLHYGQELTAVILMVGLAYGIETVSDIYYARLQLNDRMAEISKSMMARALLSVLALAATTHFSRSVVWGIGGVLAARVIILFVYDIRGRTHGLESLPRRGFLNKELKPTFHWRVHCQLLCLCLPLGIVVLLTTLNSSVPSYFVKQALGDRELGIFTALGFAISVGNMAVVSLGQSAFTRLARWYNGGEYAKFWALLARLLLFGATLALCGMILSAFAGREILTILFRAEYAERADLLPWIMAAGGFLFMAQFLGFGLTAAGHYNSQVILNILANLSLFAACFWWVARLGLRGAILAMLIGALVQLVGSVLVLTYGMRAPAPACARRVEAA